MHLVTRAKYGNKESYYNGYWYQSKLEANSAREFDLRLRAGEIKAWERQIPFELRVYGQLITTYKMDFRVTYPDGSQELIETKGFATEAWRLRWKLLEAIFNHDYPEIKLTVVKSSLTPYQEAKQWKQKAANYRSTNARTASR